jgi:TolA-binding protein
MSESKKFTQEELDQIEQLQNQNNRLIFDLGQTEMQIHFLNKELEKLQDTKDTLQVEFSNCQVQEKDLAGKLNKKYGTGTVDVNTGEFSPQI